MTSSSNRDWGIDREEATKEDFSAADDVDDEDEGDGSGWGDEENWTGDGDDGDGDVNDEDSSYLQFLHEEVKPGPIPVSISSLGRTLVADKGKHPIFRRRSCGRPSLMTTSWRKRVCWILRLTKSSRTVFSGMLSYVSSHLPPLSPIPTVFAGL